MKKELIALTTSLFAFAAVAANIAPANAEGPLAASSGATVDAGFPVITGPGTTVLTPTGAEVTDPLPRMKIPEGTPTPVLPKLQVRNYSWPKPGTRLARGATRAKTTTRIVAGSYNTIMTDIVR
ncbi:MAG: hypothetical protein K2X77_03875 [Candidatus Obscuribacterales bacterium]|jgi:hypothetical protein|nr:hypothetical protein [Candidatus Obscuribacterales bacterium]